MQLVINTPGTFITQKDECLRLKQKEKVFDISPLKVESIVITNQAMISTQAVVMALEHNIDIIFLDRFGDPLGRVWFSKMGSTALIRRKQLEAATAPHGTGLVRDMIVQKIVQCIVRTVKGSHHVLICRGAKLGPGIVRDSEGVIQSYGRS